MPARLVVGLGNPGSKYERNRHNIGFLAAESVAGKLGASGWSRKFGGEVAEARMEELKNGGDVPQFPGSSIPRLHFLKPLTYMNLSGDSVLAAASFYKIPPQHIIVLHDDLDVAPGTVRVKLGGGHGGHNGLKSIDACIGKDYWRVRIGIGHPGTKDQVSDYVLSDFGKAEWELQDRILTAVTAHFTLLLAGDAAGFMNKVALEVRP